MKIFRRKPKYEKIKVEVVRKDGFRSVYDFDRGRYAYKIITFPDDGREVVEILMWTE